MGAIGGGFARLFVGRCMETNLEKTPQNFTVGAGAGRYDPKRQHCVCTSYDEFPWLAAGLLGEGRTAP